MTRAAGRPCLSAILAIARNGVIGRDGELPWRMSDDLKWFKEATRGKPVLMGRATWDSLGKPLPGRHNIVMSRQQLDLPNGVSAAHSLDEAITLAGEVPEIMVIGGARIYHQTMPACDRLYVTRIHAEVEGDTRVELPIDGDWTITTLRHITASDKNEYDAAIEQWDRMRNE